jgi:hypothetical protein
MGLKKGTTNNPNGRPLGAMNALAQKHKMTVDKMLTDNIDRVCEELKKLNGLNLVRIYSELLKFVVPYAKQDVEEQNSADDTMHERIIKESLHYKK